MLRQNILLTPGYPRYNLHPEAKLPDNRAVTTSPPDPHKMVSGTWCPPWARNQCNWSPEPCFWWQPDQRLYWCIHVPTVHTFSELELVWKRRNKSLSTYENKFRAYLLLLWAWRTESKRFIRNQLCQCWHQKQTSSSVRWPHTRVFTLHWM